MTGRAPWRLLTGDGAGAATGLALDEALMAGYGRGEPGRPPTLRLYSYRTHCALIGRYQNLAAEVDLEACGRTGTPVSRRPTGGGAIIMGDSQLGVAYIDRAPAGLRPKQIMEALAGALIRGLAGLGITAAFRGKNDLEVGGRKVAGLGLYIDPAGAMLFHASVLADLDVPFMLTVLRIPAAKLAGRAVAAVEERITTVTALTGERHDARSVRPAIAAGFRDECRADLMPGETAEAERVLAAQLAAGRYGAREWLAERSLSADGSGSALLRTDAGLARIYLTTHGGLVKSAMVVGDFNDMPPPLLDLEATLRWRRLEPASLRAAVGASGAAPALGITEEDLCAAVTSAAAQASQRLAAEPIRTEGSCYFPGGTSSGGTS
ncbi:MAG: biotin/lipoate A/B protein ligase family protein [Streptosporangiaceae bacterium]